MFYLPGVARGIFLNRIFKKKNENKNFKKKKIQFFLKPLAFNGSFKLSVLSVQPIGQL